MWYKLKTTEKDYRAQLRAFRNDTGFIGIFKKNLHEGKKVVGEETLGITRNGQVVKIVKWKDEFCIGW